MEIVHQQRARDIVAGSSVAAAYLCSFAIGKLYHGYFALTFHDIELITYLSCSALALVWLSARRERSASVLAGRLWMCVGVLLALSVAYADVVQWQFGQRSIWLIGTAGIAISVATAAYLSASTWRRLSRVVAVVPWLVVTSPVLFGHMATSPVKWLDAPRPSPAHTATVALLFDEMNADAGKGMQDVLAKHGLASAFKAIAPVHGSTSEVIPAMFSRKNFAGAQACGTTQICAGHAALDFSKIVVGRPDVDVVGFHHPYCAMQGLRSCTRLTTNQLPWEEGRLACGLLRRTGIDIGRTRQSCEALSHRTWAGLRQQVIQALLAAPTMTQGGVLYAHIPLPHPPADGTGTLAEQYKTNLRASEHLLDTVLSRLEANHLAPRVLIFADHPLRQAMWCEREAPQFDAPCQIDPGLSDPLVPLIVAARQGLPDLTTIQSNRDVFDVLTSWLNKD